MRREIGDTIQSTARDLRLISDSKPELFMSKEISSSLVIMRRMMDICAMIERDQKMYKDFSWCDLKRHGVREAIIKPIIDANQFAASEESN